MKNKISTIVFSKATFPIWLALFTFGLTELFAHYPKLTETFYSQTLYPAISSTLSFFSKWVPLSLDDTFYALLTISLIVLLILTLLRKLKFGLILLTIVQTLAICYVLFYWLWGFNYYRTDINERLQIGKSKPDSAQFVRVLETLITQTNESYCTFDSITKNKINALVESSYQKHAAFLKLKYPQGTRVPKPISLSSFFAKAGIAGYYGPFFSEVHLNDSLLMIEYPQVLAHESAHQFGITSEAEANFYGWLVCAKSDSKYMRYSANINTLSYFISQAHRLHNYQDLIKKIDKPVIDDIRRVQQHWAGMRNERIDRAAGKINDAYLKTNKVKKGIEDYFGVVQFVMDFETDTLVQKRISETQK